MIPTMLKSIVSNPEYAFMILCFVNLLGYVDRGVIAGASSLVKVSCIY